MAEIIDIVKVLKQRQEEKIKNLKKEIAECIDVYSQEFQDDLNKFVYFDANMLGYNQDINNNDITMESAIDLLTRSIAILSYLEEDENTIKQIKDIVRSIDKNIMEIESCKNTL